MCALPLRPPAGQSLPLDLPPDLPVEYANLVRIAHSPFEMVFDFAQMLPGAPNARISSRIIMSPLSAKLLQRALGESLAKFEATFGEIAIPGDTHLAEQLFRPPSPPDKPT